MTTYTTPHFANGPTDRNVRVATDRDSIDRVRPANAAVRRTIGTGTAGDAMADGPMADWQPGKTSGVPKAAIGAVGAALVGGVALAIVLMAPSKVTKTAAPDPIAAAATQNGTARSSTATDSTEAGIKSMDSQAPAAGVTPARGAADAAATAPAVQQAQPAPAAVAPAVAPTTHVARRTTESAPAPRVSPTARQAAPVVTPDAAAATPPAATPAVEPPAPAMQQTPAAPTVTPSVPDPAPAPATTPDAPAPTQGGTQ